MIAVGRAVCLSHRVQLRQTLLEPATRHGGRDGEETGKSRHLGRRRPFDEAVTGVLFGSLVDPSDLTCRQRPRHWVRPSSQHPVMQRRYHEHEMRQQDDQKRRRPEGRRA